MVCKEGTRETASQVHTRNVHKLRETNLKSIRKISVPVFTNGISKQSMWRALFFFFSPAEAKPALGRPQLPTCIWLRQVTALSSKKGS